MAGRKKGKLTVGEMISLYNEGKCIREIAQLDGTSLTMIIRYLHLNNVEMRPQGGGPHNRWIKHGFAQRASQLGIRPDVYVRLRALLMLGGKCVQCGISDLRVLEINHLRDKIRPMKWMDYVEVLQGQYRNIEVRCASCNVMYEYEVGRRALPSKSVLNSIAGEG